MKLLRKNRRPTSSLNYRKKNRIKRVRTVLQIIFLLVIAFLFIQVVFNIERYQVPSSSSLGNEEGFIALSYFGVSRSGSDSLIAKKQLDEHLKALKNHGYTTISQQDILDFYQKNKPLPEKALFLAFEDGRNDSSIFAQPLLEKYNYKATISTYANKFGQREYKFLQPKDLLKMIETGYWELGSNGYRLTYINTFDDMGHFLNVLDEPDFNFYDVDEYNHFLMDFIRNENGIPVEDRVGMEKRINKDYHFMKDIYEANFGSVPDVYFIMHANSLYNGMNPLVENVNDQNIKSMFSLHFNREGHIYNNAEADLYDLTRVQPAPHWSTNHLLMKIKEDAGHDVTFVIGDNVIAKDWKLEKGASEFRGNKIILTSPPNEEGLLYLRKSEEFINYRLSLRMSGIPEGKQAIYLRYNEKKGTYLKIVNEDNSLSVIQAVEKSNEEILSTMSVNESDEMELQVELEGNQISIWQDDKILIRQLTFDSSIEHGGMALSSEASVVKDEDQKFDDIYYKGNDIYDGIFYDIQIRDVTNGENENIMYSNSYNDIQKVFVFLKKVMNDLIDDAIELF